MAEQKKGVNIADIVKGVSTLDTGAQDREQIEYHHIEHLIPDERNFYSLDGIDDLAVNIELVGLQQPIRVRPGEIEGSLVIVSGHRRHAALKQLTGESQELYERFCQVPCIVEHPREQSSEIETLLQELKLIYANSNTRTMSPADLSNQAEKVETLLYQLKAAGMEFPGKMRDHVAQVCNVKASKLARLKVIREKLVPELKKHWEKGDLKEVVAYTFAQQSAEVQRLMIPQVTRYGSTNREKKWWTEREARDAADCVLQELKPRNGPKGSCEKCDAAERRLARLGTSYDWANHCRTGKCCHGCPNIATCEHVCTHLKEEVEKAKVAARDKRAVELARKKKEEAPLLKPRIKLWKRFGEARKAAGLTWEEYAKKAHVTYFRREKKIADFEQGEKITMSSGGLPYCGGDGFDEWRIKPLIAAADALGVSLDYLLCRTDNPSMGAASPKAAAPAKPQWIPGEQRPKQYCSYLCKIDLGGKTMTLTAIYDPNRAQWLHPSDEEPVPYPVVGWYPIPQQDGEGGKQC